MFVLNGNQEKVIRSIKAFGFTEHEGRVMFTLQMTGRTTAWNLAEKSGVPQSKIYRVVYGLLDRGVVSVSKGSPITVRAVPLDRYLDRYQKRTLRQIRRDSKYLSRIIRELKPCFKPYDRYVRIFAPKYNGR
jgi:sugar-specific transcriptional regulator TrmB